MKKKILIIGLIIVILVCVAVAVVAIVTNQNDDKNKKDKSVGTEWGDAYYVYLDERYGEGEELLSNNHKVDTIDVMIIPNKEEKVAPKLILQYESDNAKYFQVCYIEDDEVKATTFEGTSEEYENKVEYLYDIENKEYDWYVVSNDEYITVDAYTEYKVLENEAWQELYDEKKDTNLSYNDIKDREKYKEAQKIKEDNKLILSNNNSENEISKFEEKFVVIDDVEANEFEIEVGKDIYKTVKDGVSNYKDDKEMVTKDVEKEAQEGVEALENKKQEIAEADEKKKKTEEEARRKAEEEAKKKAEEEAAKGLQVGNFTLKYGTYTTKMQECSGTLKLNPNGKFHITTNFNEGDSNSTTDGEMDTDGTYVVELHQETYPGEYEDMVTFTANTGEKFSFTVYGNDVMGDQWHSYSYTGN